MKKGDSFWTTVYYYEYTGKAFIALQLYRLREFPVGLVRQSFEHDMGASACKPLWENSLNWGRRGWFTEYRIVWVYYDMTDVLYCRSDRFTFKTNTQDFASRPITNSIVPNVTLLSCHSVVTVPCLYARPLKELMIRQPWRCACRGGASPPP